MNDIAERLRDPYVGEVIRQEAAAEIERLRAALDHLDADGVVGAYMEQRRLTETAERGNERLRAALREIVRQDWWSGDEPDAVDGRCAEIARAALGEERTDD